MEKRMNILQFLVAACMLISDESVLAQSGVRSCLQSTTSDEPIPFEDLGGGRSSDRIPTERQVIVASYQFQCCGNITRWQTFVEPGGGGQDGEYTIIFQVWRPGLGVEEDGCYSLIGEDIYAEIDLGGDGLVDRTLEPEGFLPVQPGDVVGYFMSREGRTGERDGIQLERREDDEGEEVWYHSDAAEPITTGSGTCIFSVGAEDGRVLRSFTNSAPVLRVDVDQFTCPDVTAPPPTPPPTLAELIPPQSPSSPPPPTTAETAGAATSEATTMSEVMVGTGGNNVEMIVGVVVALVLLILVMLVVIILTLFLLKRRMMLRHIKMAGATGVADFANPNYESSVSFIKTVPGKKTKGNKKKPKSTPVLPPIALDITDTAMYESMDIEDPLDYTYPRPSPTSKQSPDGSVYAYIPTTTTTGEGEGLYHVVGPHYEQSPQEVQAPPPVPSRNNNTVSNGSPPEPKNVYHLLEDPAEYNSSLLYEDPTLPTFRGPAMERDAMFESIGSYVPTEEQRELFASNYEQQEVPQTYNRLCFFVEDQVYWAPATTTSDLYAQLASKKYREIHRNQIRILEQLGSGQFGEVCKALWTVNDLTLELAVKMLISGASEDDRVRFLQEAAIMGQFSHRNVIKLHGVVTVGEPVMLCSELLKNGDLRSYLQAMDLSKLTSKDLMETQVSFLKFARDIAAGMDYLSQKSFVHRDLAARNVLLDDSLTCKIGDFGMARDLMDDTYYRSSGGKIPVKWTAPEALLYKRYSPESDVWSYGMVLFEIWSIAKKPFSTISNNQVLRLIQTGFCQAPPPGCPRAIYEIMVHCWNPGHEKRPSFEKLCSNRLQQPSARLLYWCPDDDSTSPSVAVLGAPLEQAFNLHVDLQETYKQTDH